MIIWPSLVLKWSLNHSTNVINIAIFMLHSVGIILSKISKALVLPQENPPQHLMVLTGPIEHLQKHTILKQIFELVAIYHKSHRSIENRKSKNFLVSKISLAQSS